MAVTNEDLMAAVTELASLVKDMRGDVARLDTRMTSLEGRMTGLESRLTTLEVRVEIGFQVLGARLDEQRATVNALIPTRLAAVHSAA